MALSEAAAQSLVKRGVQGIVHGVDSTRIKQGTLLPAALLDMRLPTGSPTVSL